MAIGKPNASDAKGTLFVCDIDTATCAFCPVGTEFEKGDHVHIQDEKTVFGRQTREKLVEITAVKLFRSTGRQITLDLMMISEAECQKIAEDSDLTVEILMQHKVGAERGLALGIAIGAAMSVGHNWSRPDDQSE